MNNRCCYCAGCHTELFCTWDLWGAHKISRRSQQHLMLSAAESTRRCRSACVRKPMGVAPRITWHGRGPRRNLIRSSSPFACAGMRYSRGAASTRQHTPTQTRFPQWPALVYYCFAINCVPAPTSGRPFGFCEFCFHPGEATMCLSSRCGGIPAAGSVLSKTPECIGPLWPTADYRLLTVLFLLTTPSALPGWTPP